ncbi:protein involved in gliding motility GldM [Marinilabilia salmonicolor]|jgi:gliding motility-associated protein GldM|uniref:type IX secretion system motor protein PorM/GldM n=1 Tax=Marinilabilia salmonicolor TaxID=989 RepID=UPI000D063290|nr:gliding motility protein GldM [Marinilabilia salmonicolor]PRY91416.1 protein involved in gliding motility GldM [Marinilabilia salmonicolor]
MSGGNCPETPRQKMIGMMYLFLTAMLALNVSGELLQAFQLVDSSIRKTIETMENKNSLLYSDFESAYATNEKKVSDQYHNALEVKAEADSLFKHIQDLKTLIVQTADGPEATPTQYTSLDNQDIAAQLMITERGGARSKELKEHLIHYRDLLSEMVDPADTALLNALERTLTPKDPPRSEGEGRSWESEKFEHLPMSAVMALMSQLQSEVRNMESDMIRYLYGKIDEGSFKFNSVEAIVIPRSEYVIRGDEYYAEIMLAARDTTQPPIVTVNGEELPINNGRGILRIPANSTGEKEWSGEIAVMGPDGTYTRRHVTGSYLVSQPGVVISPTKMNVFYVGVENPVEVSVPGVPSENLNVRITNARMRKVRGNEFSVSPNANSAGKQAIVSVSTTLNGQTQNLGSQPFRIKRVPDPVATVAGMRGGGIGKNLLLAQRAVIAKMDNFDFDLRFNITNFRISTIRDGYLQFVDSESGVITTEQKDLIQGVGIGGVVLFNNIQAKGPDGSTRDLGSLSFTIQ